MICLLGRILDMDSFFNEALLHLIFFYRFCQLYFYKGQSKINRDPSAKVSGKKKKHNKNNKINLELLQLSQRKKASYLSSPFSSVCTNIRHMAERSGLF